MIRPSRGVRRVRDTAIGRFHDAITVCWPAGAPPAKANVSSPNSPHWPSHSRTGCSSADHHEPDTDVEQMYRRCPGHDRAHSILLEENEHEVMP